MRLRRLALLSLLLLGGLLFVSPVAEGRAGGGQHYSSPSRSSGGGSRSSGGSSYSGGSNRSYGGSYSSGRGIYVGGGGGGASSFMVLVFVAVIIVVIVVAYQNSQRSGWQETQQEVRRIDERRLRPAEDVNAALSLLKQDDPAFDADAFFERTRKVFLDVQEAWFLRKLEPVRIYMSDGLFRRFTTLLALMEQEGQRNALADATVLNARLMEVTRTNAFDCLTVRIHASMRDIDVPASLSDDEARRKASNAGVADFTELWTFVRRRGNQTRSDLDLSQGKCPHCGAPFTGGASNKCEYCNSIVNSGNYDWVLSEITQPSEYLPHNGSAPGLDALQTQDPDAAAEILQDRGLLLFWKWLEIWAFADARRLQKLTTPAAFAGFRNEIEGMKANGKRFRIKVPAVGGTRVVALETDVDGQDRAHIEIRWSAITGVGDISSYAETQSQRSIVTMVRSTGAKTDRGTGLANERCGNCGAPLTDSDSSTCDYCGHDLSGASREWQLEALTPYEQWSRPSAAPAARNNDEAFATPGERRRLMTILVLTVKADGIIEPREMRLLKDCAQRWQIAWPEVQNMLDHGVEDVFGTLHPRNEKEARAFLNQMVIAAKVDGKVDRREKALIYETARHLKLDAKTVDVMIA